jgi:hypothetical protein
MLNGQVVRLVQYGYDPTKNHNHFRNYSSALKIAFWSLFDPGHPEVVGCSTGIKNGTLPGV